MKNTTNTKKCNYNVSLNDKGELIAVVNETKGNNIATIADYEKMISAMISIGKTATLKIVEYVARVDVTGLYKASLDSHGLPYSSLNQWAIEKFNFSKSHVSEMLKVAKQCSDIETGAILPCFAGFSYTQLLALCNNTPALTAIKNGDCNTADLLNSSAKELKQVKLVVDENGGKTLETVKDIANGTDSVDNAPSKTAKGDNKGTDNADNGNAIARIRHFNDIKGARDSNEVTLHILKNGKTLIYGYENTTIEFANELAGLNYLLSAYEVVDASDTPFGVTTSTVSATAKA